MIWFFPKTSISLSEFLTASLFHPALHTLYRTTSDNGTAWHDDKLWGCIWLLIAALLIAVLAKRLRIPYTVALVLGGLLLGLLRLPLLSPLQPNQRPDWLTPDVILILFLPALVFEDSIKIDVRQLIRDSVPLLLLANIGVVLAALVTGYLVH